MNGRFIYDIANFLSEQDERLLPSRLAATLSSIASFDGWMILCFHEHKNPTLIDYRDKKSVDTDYCLDFYQKDPFYLAAKDNYLSGAYHISEVAPRNLQATEYHQNYLSKATGFADQVGYLCPIGDGNTLFLAITRSGNYKPFRAGELSEFQLIAPLTNVALKNIWDRRSEPAVPDQEQRKPAKSRATVAFDNFGATTLSPREHQIARLLISGESAKSIARALGIAPGTTQNHIKHIYLKLGVSSRGELFGRFIDELTQCEAA